MASIPQSRPRAVRLNAGGYATVIVLSLVIGGGLVGEWLINRNLTKERATATELATNGVDVTAQVVEAGRKSNDSKPWVSYEFDANGRRVVGRSSIALSRWRDLHTGSPIAIRYSATDPTINALAGSSGNTPTWVPLLVLIAACVPAVIGGIAILREWRLLRDGRVATAVVTAIRVRRDGEGGVHRSVGYEFQALNGRTVSGKAWSPRRQPAVGTRIEIVYDPDNPKRNLSYPMQFVAVTRNDL